VYAEQNRVYCKGGDFGLLLFVWTGKDGLRRTGDQQFPGFLSLKIGFVWLIACFQTMPGGKIFIKKH